MATMASEGMKLKATSRYPHMAELDALVWTQYARQQGGDIDRVWYDVWCGEQIPLGDGETDADRRRADGIYSKRIDAVTVRSGLYQVWEIKPFGNSVALGQALMYLELFKARYPDCSPVQTCVVCDHFDRDCRPVMSKYGVECVAVGRASNYTTEHSVLGVESS